MNDIDVIVSGEKWVGYGFKSTSSTVYDLIDSAEKNLILTIFVLSSFTVFEKIKKALNRGVRIDIYIYNKLTPKEILSALNDLNYQCKYLTLYTAKDDEFIHSKIIICDKKKVYIGSANLSDSGLSTHYELGVLIEDSKIAYEVETVVEKLIS